MGAADHGERIDTASRVILATPRTLFRAFVDAETMLGWRAPDGMEARLKSFDPRVGGGYRMVLRYTGVDAASHGKTRPGEDEVEVRFVELLAEEKVVEAVRFVTDGPVTSVPMMLTTTFQPDRDGTRVTFSAANVPETIDPADHAEGMAASLRNLARLTE